MSDVDAGLVGVGRRIRQLMQESDNDETLLVYSPTSETGQGVYFLTLRCWDHPDVDDATVVSLRYAYLTKGDGSDGWAQASGATGINMRVEGDPQAFVQGLAQLFSGAAPRVGGGKNAVAKDLRPEALEE